MKRLLVSFLLLFVALSAFTQVIVYEDDALLAWDPTTTMVGGNPILSGDSVSYDIYIYDYSNVVIDNQDTNQLIYIGTTLETSMQIFFPSRKEWVVGVRGTLVDGGGASGTPSLISWSTQEEFVNVASMGGPFYYVPLVPLDPLPNPENLKDQRY